MDTYYDIFLCLLPILNLVYIIFLTIFDSCGIISQSSTFFFTMISFYAWGYKGGNEPQFLDITMLPRRKVNVMFLINLAVGIAGRVKWKTFIFWKASIYFSSFSPISLGFIWTHSLPGTKPGKCRATISVGCMGWWWCVCVLVAMYVVGYDIPMLE